MKRDINARTLPNGNPKGWRDAFTVSNTGLCGGAGAVIEGSIGVSVGLSTELFARNRRNFRSRGVDDVLSVFTISTYEMIGLGPGKTFVMSTFMANRETVDPKWFVIDATDVVVGRLAAQVASILRGKHKPEFTPHCDTGDFVVIVNVEKVKFTGKKWDDKNYQTYSHYAGGQKIIPAKEMRAKKPEEIIRLAVKRMMPKGPLAYKQLTKLKLFAGNSHEHQAQLPIEFKMPK